MIETKNLYLTYENGTQALKDVNIKIDSGDIVYIIGPSGSGKTSLLKLFMGIEYPTEGQVNVLGLNIEKGKAKKIRKLRTKIGPVFQEFKLIRGRTSLENVMMGMRFLGMSNSEIKEKAVKTLIEVGLKHKTMSLVENLSWGETQRVAIARAVARKPAIILADEPTGNLDHHNALNILKLLTSVKDENTAVIIATHATHLLDDVEVGKLIKVDNGKVSMGARGEAR